MPKPADMIRNWLHYLESGLASPDLIQAENLLGAQRLRVVLIKVLGWFKAQTIQFSPLPLNPNHEWVRNLRIFVESDCGGAVLQIVDDSLDFAERIQPSQREEIVDTVQRHHNPPLHVRPSTPDTPPAEH